MHCNVCALTLKHFINSFIHSSVKALWGSAVSGFGAYFRNTGCEVRLHSGCMHTHIRIHGQFNAAKLPTSMFLGENQRKHAYRTCKTLHRQYPSLASNQEPWCCEASLPIVLINVLSCFEVIGLLGAVSTVFAMFEIKRQMSILWWTIKWIFITDWYHELCLKSLLALTEAGPMDYTEDLLGWIPTPPVHCTMPHIR